MSIPLIPVVLSSGWWDDTIRLFQDFEKSFASDFGLRIG
jgi:hypothetical protein